MHIVFAIHRATAGGAVLGTCRRQAEDLAERGHVVTVVSNACPSDWKNVKGAPVPVFRSRLWEKLDYGIEGVSRRILSGRRLSPLNMSRVLPQAVFPHSAAREIMRIHQTAPVNAIVCCQHVMAFGLRKIKAAVGIPFVLVSQGDIFQHPPGSYSLPMTWLYRRAAIASYRSASHVMAVSRQIRDRGIACGARPENVSIIPNGIQYEEISGQGDVNTPPKARVAEIEILFVGRFAAEKAADVLLRALASLPHVRFRLRLIGVGPLEGFLKDLVKSLGIEKKCEFVGPVPRRELAAYYTTSDFLVLPSLADAQPIVTLEAQVCGLPVIASNVGGIPDVVEHEKNGLLVPPSDAKALAEAILRLSSSKELRAKMSQQAFGIAPQFAWPNLLQRFAGIVEGAGRTSSTKAAIPVGGITRSRL